MKNIILLIVTYFIGLNFSNAQIIIGPNSTSPTIKESVLLGFTEGENKGIILPYVKTRPSGNKLKEGTIILNASNPAQAKIEYYNGSWQDLSSNFTGNISVIMATQPEIQEDPESKVIMGSTTTSADGILVLESDTKALVLPKVNSTDDIVSPAPGMMVMVIGDGANMLAVFNGSAWTFWEAE